MVTAPIEHISLDERGIAYVSGTRIKVRHIAIARTAQRFSVEEIREAYPHLSLAQVHAALAYYYDHKDSVDAEITEAARIAEDMRVRNPNPLTRAALEARHPSEEDPSHPG